VRLALERHIVRASGKEIPFKCDAPTPLSTSVPAKSGLKNLTAIDTLVSVFGLSTFERSVLLLCAGMELDARFSALCANAQLEPRSVSTSRQVPPTPGPLPVLPSTPGPGTYSFATPPPGATVCAVDYGSFADGQAQTVGIRDLPVALEPFEQGFGQHIPVAANRLTAICRPFFEAREHPRGLLHAAISGSHHEQSFPQRMIILLTIDQFGWDDIPSSAATIFPHSPQHQQSKKR
jgi:hypothetical protein